VCDVQEGAAAEKPAEEPKGGFFACCFGGSGADGSGNAFKGIVGSVVGDIAGDAVKEASQDAGMDNRTANTTGAAVGGAIEKSSQGKDITSVTKSAGKQAGAALAGDLAGDVAETAGAGECSRGCRASQPRCSTVTIGGAFAC